MKPLVSIVRIEESSDGTFGVLSLAGRAFCVTLECPNMDNRQFVSCIPAGRYSCRRVLSPRHGHTFEITGVPGRDAILFHRGNIAEDTSGCILLGRRFGSLGSHRGILASSDAMDEFLATLAGEDSFDVEIVGCRTLAEAA